MGCASSIVPQQQPDHPRSGRLGRPKRKLNALVPEPPARPAAPAPSSPRAGLVSPSGPSASVLGPARAVAPPVAAASDPQSYEELCVAFLKAVKRGDVPAMERLAQLCVRLTPTPQSLVNIRGMWDSTPLVYAAQYAHAEAAHWLLARGADVLAQNEKGVTALLLASLEGLADVCERILSVAALIGSTDSEGLSQDRDERGLVAPRAVDQQVGVVYNAAADVNVRLSPLLAASMNGHAAVLALLLANGADPNWPVGSAATGGVAVGSKQFALLLAAKFGHAAVLELLLAHDADCAVRDASSSHAVLLACENRREDCALLLLRHAAYDQVDSDGAVVARRNVWLQPNRHGLTALHLAATHGLVGAVEALVALARDQSAVDGGGGAEDEGLRAFLDAASVTRGETALLMACRKRQFEVARVLLGAGADAARADRGGTTPAQVLARSEQPELLAKCLAVAAATKPTGHSPQAGENADPTTASLESATAEKSAASSRVDGEQQAACGPSGSAPVTEPVACDEGNLVETVGANASVINSSGDRAASRVSLQDGGSPEELPDRPATSVEAAPSSVPPTGIVEALNKPDESGSTGQTEDTATASAAVAASNSLIAEDMERVVPLDAAVTEQLVGDATPVVSSTQGSAVVLSVLLPIECDSEAVAPEPASPRCTETEERASSSASASPTKERTKKSSKRNKKRDHGDPDQASSSPSLRRHRRHRRHSHKTAGKSAVTGEGDEAEGGRGSHRAAKRLAGDDCAAPTTR